MQLGNLLYVLLRAHVDRFYNIDESYVLRMGHFRLAQIMFSKTTELFSKGNGQTLMPFGYFQRHNIDFDSKSLDDFCLNYLLDSVQTMSKDFKEYDISLAIRRSDYLKGDNKYYYGYDSIDYISNCFKKISELEDLTKLTLRITSDDKDWCETYLIPYIHSNFGIAFENIMVEDQDVRDNFVQLYSCSKYFVCPNSTYGYWVGYLLRLGKPNVLTFVPNFNTTLISKGKQIADTRNWIVVDVNRDDYVR